MKDSLLVEPRALRVGMHIELDLSWMQHPFPLNSFRITSEPQLAELRALGLPQIRVLRSRSDPETLAAFEGEAEGVGSTEVDAPADAGVAPAAAAPSGSAMLVDASPEVLERRRRRAALDAEQASAALAERQYLDAGRCLKRSYELATSQPDAARTTCEAQVTGFLDALLDQGEMAIRLLGIGVGAGDRAAQHAVNVTVISLLLGQQLGLDKAGMFDLGVGSMLHDIGKLDLPDRVRWLNPLSANVPAHERSFYQQHVPNGVTAGRRMGLAPGALLVIAQHHEHADGSGFPLSLRGDKLSPAARIVALVNVYDNLCNPISPANALTPHEALALMYGQMKARFDAATFGAFVKMMGVYPPGSVVQLSDERYALVVNVNAARPLKPRVLVHDASQPRELALPLDLEQEPSLSIRRSLKPQQLPRATLDYLSPRPRVCYFFERAREFTASLQGALA